MRIAIVSVPLWVTETPPINIAYLKAYVQTKGHKAKCFDLNIALFSEVSEEERVLWNHENNHYWIDEQLYEKHIFRRIVEPRINAYAEKILSWNPEAIGISVHSPLFTKNLIEQIRKMNKKVLIIVGGQMCSDAMRCDFIKEIEGVDIIVNGEGEYTLGRILDIYSKEGQVNFCAGCLIRRGNIFVDCGESERIKEIDSLPFPDFNDFDLSVYSNSSYAGPAKQLPVLFSRGCCYACDFCLQRQIWKNKIYSRKADKVYEELVRNKEKYNITSFIFADLLINFDSSELEKFCDLLIAHDENFEWWGSARIDPSMTQEQLIKLKKAGCHLLSLGVESASDHVLEAMRKPFRKKDIIIFFRKMHIAGIHIVFNLIIGHPEESEQDFLETLAFLRETNDIVRFPPSPSLCAIFKKTDLYNKMKTITGNDQVDIISWNYKSSTLKERERRVEVLKSLCLTLYNNFKMVGYEKKSK